MQSTQQDLVEHYFQLRQKGMELKKIRLELEAKGVSPGEVSEIMSDINDKELESLQSTSPFGVGLAALSISGIFLLSGVALFFWMRSKGLEAYQFLAVIPIILCVGSYLLFRQNKQKMDRRGLPIGGK